MVILRLELPIQCDVSVVIHCGIESRWLLLDFSSAENLYCKTAAVIQGHGDAIWIDIQGDDDADKPDPFYRVVEMEVEVLTYAQEMSSPSSNIA